MLVLLFVRSCAVCPILPIILYYLNGNVNLFLEINGSLAGGLFPFGWRRESAVAGDIVVRKNSNQPFARGVDNAAAGDAGGVAAEAHAHG